jgi:hypothetical protein
MAALAGAGNHGSLNGLTHVELVATPGAGVFRMIRALYINHTDSATVVLHLAKKIGANEYQFHSQLMLQGYTVEFGDGDSIILVQGESVVGWLDSAPATNPTFVVSFGDK